MTMKFYLLFFIIHGFIKTVISTNQVPAITTPTSPISVNENESGQLLLYTLIVSDADGDAITCYIPTTEPNTTYFGVWYNSTDFGLHVMAGSTLDHNAAPEYILTVECTDNTDSASLNVTVGVTPNSPPTLSNIPGTISVDASTVLLGDPVFTVTAADTDSTSLAFSMTSIPVSPAMFTLDPVSGIVTPAKDLTYAVANAYDLTITVSDWTDTATSNLIIQLNNLNTAPIINNLPTTINVREDTGQNTVIFYPSITEPDSGDTTTVTFVVTPSLYTSKFRWRLNSQFRIGSGENLNYEDQNVFTVTFTVSDGKASNGDYNLTINVVDVQEACSFTFSYYYITMQEGSVGDTVDPKFETNQDAVSSYTYTLQSTTDASYFDIDTTSGNISFAVNYDVDGTHPNSTNFRVYCHDNLGTTGQTNLYVTVEDVNDNAPVFSDTFSVIQFDRTMIPPHNVTTLSATDADSGENALLSYSWSTSSAGGSYFTLNPSGVILLTTDPELLSYGTSFRFIVVAVDNGYPALSGTTTLELLYLEGNATTTVPTSADPDTSESFWDKPGNTAVVVLGIILGLLMCGIAACILMNYVKKKRLQRLKTQKVKPASDMNTENVDPGLEGNTPNAGFGEGQNPKPQKAFFDFWRADELNQNLSTTITKTIGQPDISSNTRFYHPRVV